MKAGGGFGDIVAWHPYWGVHNKDLKSTVNLLSLTPAGKEVWITEVGAFGRNIGRSINDSEAIKADRVSWIISTLAAVSPRLKRIHYYHMRGAQDPAFNWDTGLTDWDGRRRLSWYLWCAASHGGNAADPSCTGMRSSAPAVASWGPGRLDVFLRGSSGALVHRAFDNGQWYGWNNRGGVINSSPEAVSWGQGRIDVFARGTGNAPYPHRL